MSLYASTAVAPASLATGSFIASGEYLHSTNRMFYFTLQPNGNLVLNKSGSFSNNDNIVWQSNTGGKGIAPYKLMVQDDGNMVIYDSTSKPIWATDSQASKFTLENIVTKSTAVSDGATKQFYYLDRQTVKADANCILLGFKLVRSGSNVK